MAKLWFLCPQCNTLTSLDSWGEYPYTWQLLCCPRCDKYYDPVANQVIKNDNKGKPVPHELVKRIANYEDIEYEVMLNAAYRFQAVPGDQLVTTFNNERYVLRKIMSGDWIVYPV